MGRKGIELPFSEMLVGFLFLGAVVLIYLLLIARVQDVHVWLLENEADFHAINLAQVLLSSNIAYSDGNTVHRGVFDASKLDALDAGLLKNLSIWYPDAVAVVGIEDLQTGKQWKAVLAPEKVGDVAISDFLSCLNNNANVDVSMIFRVPLFSPWEWPDLVKCFTVAVDQIVPAVRDFPVNIRVSDSEIHSGRMIISLRQLIFGGTI